MKLRTILFFSFLLISGPASLLAQPKIDLENITSGLLKPVSITHAGDDRLFIVEQLGKIRILNGSGTLLSTPFLDISSRVSKAGEQGLLGLAFHPDYHSNGYFFVNYTNLQGDTRVSRFNVNALDPQIADAESESVILSIDQPYSNHNAGDLKFGPDGYLYISTGDGGSGGDPLDKAQDSLSLLGKILRIDVNVADTYAIPVTNPFIAIEGARDEIWAIGLRNPWRFSFDRVTGDLWIGDVGQGAWEEINYQEASSPGGENYGWRCYEGNHTYNQVNCAASDSFAFPVHEYSHSATGGCSVTGGFVYRGSDFPGIKGYYFFTDYCIDRLWSLHDSAGMWILEDHSQFNGNSFSTFGEDSEGELYLAGLSNGVIYRIIDTTFIEKDTVCIISDTSYTVSDTGFTVSDSSYILSDTTCVDTDTSFTISGTIYHVSDTSYTIADTTYFVTDTAFTIVDTIITISRSSCLIEDTIFTLVDTSYVITDSTYSIVDSICTVGDDTFIASDTSLLIYDTTFMVYGSSHRYRDSSFVILDTNYVIRDTTYHIVNTTPVYSGDSSQTDIIIPQEISGLIIYPNPAENFLEIKISDGPDFINSITIQNIHGNLIFQIDMHKNPLHLNVEFLKPGVYIIGVRLNGKTEFRRFLKK